jgi:hypothetical protein
VASRTHVLTPPLPLRAVAVSAVLALLGAVIVVLAGRFDWSIIVGALGWLFLLCAVVLLVTAALSWRAMRVLIELTDEGYLITGPSSREEGRWADVTRVTQTPTTLVLHHGNQRRVQLVSPRGVTAEMVHLSGDIARRLDVDRGYGSL